MPDWIRVQRGIHDDPQVVALAAALDIPVEQAVGHLVALWLQMAEHAPRGDVKKFGEKILESWARWPGDSGRFAEEFAVQFVRRGVVKNWGKYNGKPIRRAELAATRARAWREKRARERNAERTRSRTRSKREPNVERDETRRDETRRTPSKKKTTPTVASRDQAFESFWEAYPTRPNNPKTKARRAWAARMREGVSPLVLLHAAGRYAAYVERTKTEPRHVKQAATFLGPDQHWLEDYGEPASRPMPLYDENGLATTEASKMLGVPIR